MFKLLSKKRIEHIRLNELLSEASVSKSTFYRLFTDKYDLMNQCYVLTASKVLNSVSDRMSLLEMFEKQFEYFYENRNFFQNAFKISEESDAVSTYITAFTMRFYMETIKEKSGMSVLPHNIQRTIQFTCSGSVSILKEWIEGGCKTNYLDEAHLQYELVPDVIKKYFRSEQGRNI